MKTDCEQNKNMKKDDKEWRGEEKIDGNQLMT